MRIKRPITIGFAGNIWRYTIDAGYGIDLLVDNQVIVEIKTVERLIPIHEARLLTYLKLSGRKLGLIINFNNRLLKDGIKRLVN